MGRKPVLVQFDEELLERLDQLTEAQGRSRSAVVRDAVASYVIEQSEADKDRRMIEAYTRMPDDGEFDAWAEESGRDMVKEEPW